MKNSNFVFFFIFAMVILLPMTSAAFNITNPSPNDFITSPTIFVNLSSGTALDCYFNYNNVKNVSVNCNGVTMVKIPSVDGVYNLTFGESYPASVETVQQITLKMPSGLVIVLYSLIFFVIVFSLIFLFLYAFGKLVTIDMDLLDVCLNIGVFFVLLFYQTLQMQYMGSAYIDDWMLFIIDISIWTNVIFPILALLITMIWGPFLRMKYPNLFARMPGGSNVPDPDEFWKSFERRQMKY